jgi:uncharacterized membrane protein YfcA
MKGVDETPAAIEGTATSAVEETGAVGALVGMLTGGFVIAAAAGFVVGLVLGAAIGRRATPPPPRWQAWR